MPTKYSLIVNNKSRSKGVFCLYVTEPDGNRNLYSLAWRTALAHPNTVFRFEWTLDFSFVWSETGILTPSDKFFPVQMINTNPNDAEKNSISLTQKQDRQGMYIFENTTKKTRVGNMGIYTKNIPNDAISVGLCVSGKPALVAQAAPNISYVFQPNFTYWLAFGDYTEGELLDTSSDTNNVFKMRWTTESYRITYPNGVFERSLLLDERNEWALA